MPVASSCWLSAFTSCVAHGVLENMSADGERALLKNVCLRLLGELLRAPPLTVSKGSNLLKLTQQSGIPQPLSYFTLLKTMHTLLIYIGIVLHLNKPTDVSHSLPVIKPLAWPCLYLGVQQQALRQTSV